MAAGVAARPKAPYELFWGSKKEALGIALAVGGIGLVGAAGAVVSSWAFLLAVIGGLALTVLGVRLLLQEHRAFRRKFEVRADEGRRKTRH